MSYQERRAIVSLISNVLITGVYSAIMFQRYPEGDAYSPDVFRFWGSFFMLLILVSIVSKIIIFIIFSIIDTIATREEIPSITDERDRLIEWKSTRYSLYTFTAGFVLAMGSLVLDMPPSTMFIILFGSGFVASIINDVSEFFFYRRGV